MKSILNEKWIVCRVCLQQPQDGMQTIFDQNLENDLTQMILECGGVPIKQYDHYPDKICLKCLKYLHIAHKFRTTCQKSHKHLSRFIAPVVVDGIIDPGIPEISLEVGGVVDLASNVEHAEIKQEMSELEEDCENDIDVIVETYEPMDSHFEEFEELASDEQADLGEEVEYLDVIDEVLNTSDEEFIPYQKPKRQTKTPKTVYTGTADSTSKKDIRHLPLKRAPKPKNAKIKNSAFICDVCGNLYPSQGRLNEHIKLHRGIKPHDCEICGYAFAQAQQLARHMNTHTGNRPYKCTYCPAAFADLSTRNKHHRIHTNERPYVCDVCGKSFTYTNTLKFHKMIHTGEKPYVCEICGKGFQQSYKLRNHKVIHSRKSAKLEKIDVKNLSYQEGNVAAAHILEI